jgi:hypothetical protein
MAALDIAGAIANVKSMLSNLSAWQTICGVSTSALAAARIYEGGTDEDEELSLTPCIFLDVTSLPTNWLANHLRGTLAIEIRVELDVPEDQRTTYSTQYVWVWGKFGELMAGINGAVDGSGQLMIEGLSVPTMPGRIDPNTNSGRCEWGFIYSLTVDFR